MSRKQATVGPNRFFMLMRTKAKPAVPCDVTLVALLFTSLDWRNMSMTSQCMLSGDAIRWYRCILHCL